MNSSETIVDGPVSQTRRIPKGLVWGIAGVLFLCGLYFAWAVVFDTTPKVQGYEVVNTYPHDPGAFSQGLVIVDGQLYESTGLFGQSTLRKVDLKTGQVQDMITLHERVFGEGLAVVDDALVQITWKNQVAYLYDLKTFKYQKARNYRGEGWGLTYDGKHLILSDGSERLRFINPKNFRVERRLKVTEGNRAISDLNELEYVKGEIYANVWHTDRIARISPETGKVLGWIDLTGLLKPGEVTHKESVLNGIAYDAKTEKLYVTGKNWPKLFEIKIKP